MDMDSDKSVLSDETKGGSCGAAELGLRGEMGRCQETDRAEGGEASRALQAEGRKCQAGGKRGAQLERGRCTARARAWVAWGWGKGPSAEPASPPRPSS